MKYIGPHVSSEPSVAVAPVEAAALGASAFSFNLVNPKYWSSPALTEDVITEFRAECGRLGFSSAQILPHSAFVINLGGSDARKRALSRRLLIDELSRCKALGLTMLNLHPGSHLGKISEEESLGLIAENINAALAVTSGVTVVLENTAGQGSALGFRFDHIARIIEAVDDKSRVGVCVDTAHAHAAGYDLSTDEGYDAMWHEFDTVLGRARLKGMHLNDSLRPAASRIDRHAPIGAGTIGAGAFRRLMADPRTDGIPLILETPDPSLWTAEMEELRHAAQESL